MGTEKDDTKQPSTYRFLTHEAAQSLPKFQYNGADNSLIYQYILSPLAGILVDTLTPTWLAPNVITLTGFAFMVTSYGILYHYCPSLDSCAVLLDETSLSTAPTDTAPPPGWIFVVNAIAMLLYQTLDNLDGKQARKTGSASPLGLLFDHGIDAANSIFGSVNWIIAMGLNTHDHLFQMWVMVRVFYCDHLCRYSKFVPIRFLSRFFIQCWSFTLVHLRNITQEN